jgi:hypothetical protein
VLVGQSKTPRTPKNKPAVTTDVVWEYGVGREGVKQARGALSSISCVIVGRSFPWWIQGARAEDLTVSRIWLTEYSSSLELHVGRLAFDIPMEVSNVPSDESMTAILRCEVLLVGGRIPDELVERGLWRSTVLRVVVSTARSRLNPPKPWITKSFKINHSTLGGVTNGWSIMVVHTIPSNAAAIIQAWDMGSHAAQDLRWVLKAGVRGTSVPHPDDWLDGKPGTRVVPSGNNAVSSMGLYPILQPHTLVHTEFGGALWVKRSVTSYERLLMMDVSEQLIKEVEAEHYEELLESIHTPGKVLQAVLHHVVDGVRRTGSKSAGVKRTRSDDSYLVPMESVSKKLRSNAPSPIISELLIGRSLLMDDTAIQKIGKVEVDMSGMRRNRVLSTLVEVENDDTSVRSELVDHNVTATKSDNAEVRMDLWDSYLKVGLDPVVQGRPWQKAAALLRPLMMGYWRRNVLKSYVLWEKMEKESGALVCDRSRNAARDCISRCCDASWWVWDRGSRPFFWRWPRDYLESARDGTKAWFVDKVRPWCRPQRMPRHTSRMSLITEKLDVIRKKGYVEPGLVSSLMSFFEVAKGETDVRMVYDGSASGLNMVLWAPWFPLPTVNGLIRSLEPGYSMADNDVGEMFHNFVLHETMQQYCGLDLTLFYPPEADTNAGRDNSRVWERWTRLAMGLRNSPYNAVQAMLMAEEMILGDRHSPENVFRWESVRLNLPGDNLYDPSKSWVCKVRAEGMVAADVFIYVDDIRSSAPTQEEAWIASQRTSSVLGFLGLQDAARKRRDPGQETGAWTGSVVWTSAGEIVVMTTQEKWDKTRKCLEWIAVNMDNAQGLDGRTMKSYRGFLVYVARTYGSLVPYLKGIHATIDSWRPGRDEDGWKWTKASGKRKRTRATNVPSSGVVGEDDAEWYEMEALFDTNVDETNEPEFVKPVPRLRSDIRSLIELTSSITPPHRKVRMSKQARVMYGFGDASKQGFGTTIEFPDKQIYWKHGQWRSEIDVEQSTIVGSTITKERSSNYRELKNLVEALEESFNKGWLDDREIFMFTDNSTAESAYFKGTSSSELLFALVLRLRKVEMSGKCMIHLVHVAGTRMIWQGTDGLSRGDRNAGVMAGASMLSFVPLHLSALERSEKILPWVKLWCTMDNQILRQLEHDDWPTALVLRGIYLWTPPPAAADVAAEYMTHTIHKRSTSTHVFICPRLMTARWFRLVSKAADLLFYVPVNVEIWNASQHEPLIIAIVFPLSREKPWKQRGSPYCHHTRKVLQELCVSDFGKTSAVLRECIDRAWNMAAV